MPAILAVVLRILGFVSTILGIANAIDAKPLAEEGHPLEIQTAVLATGQFVVDPVIGIPRVISNQAALLAALGSLQTTLLAAIGSPAQDGTAPSWWIAPPTGGSAPTSADNADAVWGRTMPFGGGVTIDALSEAWKFAHNVGSTASFPLHGSPCLSISGTFWNDHQSDPQSHPPVVDAYSIIPGEGILDWLNRTTGFTWGFDPANGDYPTTADDIHNDYVYICPMSNAQFEFFQKGYPASSASNSAPVWPGIAGVTLGSPVALSPTCVVTGPMHGVIIDITSAAPRQVYQVFGGMQGYRFVGGLQFVDDHGEAERIQSLGMAHEVILCKSMAEAASCSIRTDSAVSGTATPFVIT